MHLIFSVCHICNLYVKTFLRWDMCINYFSALPRFCTNKIVEKCTWWKQQNCNGEPSHAGNLASIFRLLSNTTQVDKECTNSVHSIPLPKWVFYHCSVHSFYTFLHHSIYTPLTMIQYSVNKPEKSVKQLSHSFDTSILWSV